MIVSDRKKFMFVHIYKTGGSSLTRVLSEYVDKKYLGVTDPVYEGPNWQSGWHLGNAQHMWFSSAIQLLPKDLDFEPYCKFTFVRHPLDWLMSIYFEFYRNIKGNAAQILAFQ